MTCPPPNYTSDTYLACVGLSPRYTEAQVSAYADRVGATGAPWIRPNAIAFLRINRMVYWKRTPGGLVGDCGTSTALSPNTDQLIGRSLAQAAVTDPEPISNGVLNVAARIFSIFGGAHAQAVVNEQTTLCNVTVQYDQFADAMEQALASGQIALLDAQQQLKQVHDTLVNALAHIEKPYNAAYGYHRALDALALFNTEIVYPSLIPDNPVSSLLGQVGGLLGFSPSGAPSTPSESIAGFSLSPTTLILLLLIGIFAFKGRR